MNHQRSERFVFSLLLAISFFSGAKAHAVAVDRQAPGAELAPIRKVGHHNVRVAQLVQGKAIQRNYANALPTLLEQINHKTTIKIDPDPAVISSFEDPAIFEYPFIFVNFADRGDWMFSSAEQSNLKRYLERGGFIYIDAGINAAFLRGSVFHGQHHSYADWEVSPQVAAAFQAVLPGKEFHPLGRDHALFKACYQGLPDPALLPDSVREYVVQEKWPEGTYSAVALTLGGRIAVLATPIVSMGWGKSELGTWSTTIRFRVLESEEGLSEYLQAAAYSGDRYEVTREDRQKDIIYCQQEALPAWVQEPGPRWRVFRYYQSAEISDYAHVFYTQLGINVMVYALTH